MRSCKMNEIIKIFEIDFVSFVTGLIIILAAVAAFLKVTEPIITRIQQSVIRKKELGDQAATILKHTRMIDDIVKCLQELEDLSNHKDEEIASRLDKLTEMHISSEIDHLRWEIINFASALANGKKCSKEQFDQIIGQHTKYKKLLEKNNLENGQVTQSMNYILDQYQNRLQNGFN